MDVIDPEAPPPHWIEALDRAEASVAAGRMVDAETVHHRLRAGIERMKAKKAITPSRQQGHTSAL